MADGFLLVVLLLLQVPKILIIFLFNTDLCHKNFDRSRFHTGLILLTRRSLGHSNNCVNCWSLEANANVHPYCINIHIHYLLSIFSLSIWIVQKIDHWLIYQERSPVLKTPLVISNQQLLARDNGVSVFFLSTPKQIWVQSVVKRWQPETVYIALYTRTCVRLYWQWCLFGLRLHWLSGWCLLCYIMHSCSDCWIVCCSELSPLPWPKTQNNDLRSLMYPLTEDVGSAVNHASTQIQCKQVGS